MNKILSWAVMAALLMGCNTQVNGQAADESSEQRKAKILENLQYQIPQIRDVFVVMGDLTDSGIDGLDQGSFTINGQQTYQFLVTSDDATLYLLAADPIDVSLSPGTLHSRFALCVP